MTPKQRRVSKIFEKKVQLTDVIRGQVMLLHLKMAPVMFAYHCTESGMAPPGCCYQESVELDNCHPIGPGWYKQCWQVV